MEFNPFELLYLKFHSACFSSNLDHPGLVRLIAAHARPPDYLLFFEFYESPNLAEKLHIEEWNPTTDEVLVIAIEIGRVSAYPISSFFSLKVYSIEIFYLKSHAISSLYPTFISYELSTPSVCSKSYAVPSQFGDFAQRH